MNKKIAGILISVIFWTTYVSAAAYGIFKYSDTTRYVTVEKTGASHQEIIAGVSGKSILIRNIELFVDAACSMYMYQATSASPWATATNKIVMPPCDQDGNFGYTKNYYGSDSGKNLFPALDSGNSLYMWTSADPDEGWVKAEIDFVNAE